jgi:hypothetical protein
MSTVIQSRRIFLPSATLESRVLALTGKGLVVLPKLGVSDDIANNSLIGLHEF